MTTVPVDVAWRARCGSAAYLAAPSWLGEGRQWRKDTPASRRVAAAAAQAATDLWLVDRQEPAPGWVRGRVAAEALRLVEEDGVDPLVVVKAARFANRWAAPWERSRTVMVNADGYGAESAFLPWTEAERQVVVVQAIRLAALGLPFPELLEELDLAGTGGQNFVLHPMAAYGAHEGGF